jgi:flagellar protein FlbD
MIKLTRLDGSVLFVNDDQIEVVEETPDTHITLVNGNRYLVLESAAVLIERIISFKAKIFSRCRESGKNILSQAPADSFQIFQQSEAG